MKTIAAFATVLVCITAVYGCTHGDVQLVGGNTTNEGRVEVCVGQMWGTVCDDGFYSNDARVVCRQLGYDVNQYGTYTYKHRAYHGQGNGTIWLDDVQCDGTEERLLDCRATPIGEHNCGHHEDVGVVCSGTCVNGTVHLIGGLVPTEGTVQMCVGGRWRELCNRYWGNQEAVVVCRQLGLPATAAVAISGTNFRPMSVVPLNLNFRCYGNELSLMNCSYSSSTCYYWHTDAAVRCAGDIVSAGTCLQGSIHLIGPNGPNTVEGRVEYCSDGIWGIISSYGFDTRDGEVVCRRLGYQHPRAQIFSGSSFGQKTGPVLLTGLSCTGTEYSLAACPRFSSYSSSDIGVRCLQKVMTSCTHGSVRLMNGSTSDEGRVEMCVNGEWGSVCDNGWDLREAQVVCSQLGYNPSWAIYYRNSKFGDGTLPPLAQSFRCSGTENNLTSCGGTTGYSSCYYGRTAGVRCFSSTGCVNGAVRLVNGKRPSEGSVQICVDGVWGHVCEYYYLSTTSFNNARVVCRQLGYSKSLYSPSYSLFNGGPQRPVIYGRVSCNGSEQTFPSCSKYVNSYCQNYKLGVICEVPSNCTSGDVQLVNGSSGGEGRVEVCYHGVWTTVDGYYWDYRDARVLCRQLGYDDKWAVAIRDFGSGNKRLVYRYHCSGSEVSLKLCSNDNDTYTTGYYTKRAYYWYYRPRAAVECQQNGINNTITCTMEGVTRLVSGSTEREGRVEVCHDGYWGTVCSDLWTEEDAYVVCRQTGGHRIRAIPVTDGRFGKGVGPVHMSYVRCNGDEMSLLDCSHGNGVGVTNCHHGRDAGVVCEEISMHTIYEVSIEAQGSLTIGSTVTLHCNVTPRPVQPFTYIWRTTYYTGASISHTSATSPDATVVIQPYHTKHGHYYCIIKKNEFTIGTGVTRIEILNILQPAVPVPLMATTGSDVTLRVNVTDTDKNTYLRELTWYHNGVKINPTSKYRLDLSSDNTSLSISSVSDSDAGEYRVQYDGLRLYPYNAGCERQTLDLFRHYPLLAPAVLYLSTDGSAINSQRQMLSSVSAVTHKQVFNTTTSHIDLVVNVDQSAVVDYLYDYWFHNGNWLYKSIPHFVPHFDKQAKFTVTNPTIFDSGVYETVMIVNTYTLISSMCDNPSLYRSFMGTYYAVIGSDIQNLLYSETPSTELTAVSSSLPAGHTTTVTCTGRGGYPPVNSISLYKNNELLMSSSSGVLQYNTNNRNTTTQYGIYKCVIDYSINTIQRQLLLQEQGQLVIMFLARDCSMWTNSKVTDFEKAFSKSIDIFRVQGASFVNSSLSCSSPSLTFTSTLVYSSDDGSLTATNLIKLIQSQITSTENTTITVSGVQLLVQETEDNEATATSMTTPSISVGLFFGGFVSASLIFVVVIIILIILILKYRNQKQVNCNTSDTGNISTEAHYYSSAQAVTLSKVPKRKPTEKQHKPAAAAARTPLKPKTQQMSTSVPSMKWDANPSYDYIAKQPNQKSTDQYNREYETIYLNTSASVQK